MPWKLIYKTTETKSTVIEVLPLTSVYLPSRKDPKISELSYANKFGTRGGDYPKKKVGEKLEGSVYYIQ